MKYIIILGDGMADWPVKEFGGKTILQNARKPYMDMLARKGRTGMLKTVPDGSIADQNHQRPTGIHLPLGVLFAETDIPAVTTVSLCADSN